MKLYSKYIYRSTLTGKATIRDNKLSSNSNETLVTTYTDDK